MKLKLTPDGMKRALNNSRDIVVSYLLPLPLILTLMYAFMPMNDDEPGLLLASWFWALSIATFSVAYSLLAGALDLLELRAKNKMRATARADAKMPMKATEIMKLPKAERDRVVREALSSAADDESEYFLP